MISHETLTKATVAGAATLFALSLPFLFQQDDEKKRQPRHASIECEMPYAGPALHAAPSAEETSRDVARAESIRPSTKSTRGIKINGKTVSVEPMTTHAQFDPKVRAKQERRSSMRVLQAGIARPESEDTSTR